MKDKPVEQMSELELHLGAARSYLETDGNIDAALEHLCKAERLAGEQAAFLDKINKWHISEPKPGVTDWNGTGIFGKL